MRHDSARFNLSFSERDVEFQKAVRAWFNEAWPSEARARCERSAQERFSVEEQVSWHKALAAKGWAATNWPAEYGGAGFAPTESYIFELERVRAGAPPVNPFGVNMVGPVIIKFGTPRQRQRFLPPTLNGDIWWCQGYSEPGAGSDLAALATRAVRRGDDYVVSGLKTWTTGAQHADWMFCLVRTSVEKTRQLGITFLLIDLRSPGVRVAPIETIDQPPPGYHETNTVYLEDVVVPVVNRIGEEGKGWTYAKYLLEFERSSGYAPILHSALARIRAMASTISDGCGQVVACAPDFIRALSELEVSVSGLEVTELRALCSRAAGESVGAAASHLNTLGTELLQRATELAIELAAMFGLPLDRSYPVAGDGPEGVGPAPAVGIVQHYINTRKFTIAGGSSEIQRNIMAKAVLDL